MKAKAMLLGLCAALLVAVTVLGAVAFLTSEAQVTNTFTVGRVSIILDEARVDLNGSRLTGSAAGRDSANTYKLIPGHSYVKDPTVHVAADSEDCWLFVKLENGLKAIVASDSSDGVKSIEEQMTEKGWSCTDTANGIWAYENRVSAGDSIPVFDSFKLTDTAEVSAYKDSKIIVTAYAIQAEGFDTASAAWATAGAALQD